MSARPFYETVYHCNDWTLADAFRPQPGWGSRRFTVPVSVFGPHSLEELVAGAREAAPPGHRLTSITLYPEEGAEQVLWSTPPDPRFKRAATKPAQEGS